MTSPIRDDDVALMCEAYESSFNAGDQQSLMLAIRKCLAARETPPDWAADALCEAIRRVERFEAVSWDEVLGKPHKGRKIDCIRSELAVRWTVFARVHQLRKQRPKPRDIFSIVANELNISRATCKRYFENLYGYRKRLRKRSS
jgi:hypothetical protein